MRIELALTSDKRWWPEGGASHWGFGIEVTHFGSADFNESDEEILTSEGRQVTLLLGAWALIFYSEAAFAATHGGELDLYRTFEVVRP